MSDRLVSREAIENLRRAANTQDWNQWRPALDRALAEVAPETLLELTEAILRDGLATFERHNPGETWPRQALDGLVTGLGPGDHPGPGGNSFAVGVENLVEARGRVNEPDACRNLLAEAVGESVMAMMCAAWGEDFPDKWRRSHQIHTDGLWPGVADPMQGWSRDPRVQKVELDGWNDVIDRLEALERSAPDHPDGGQS